MSSLLPQEYNRIKKRYDEAKSDLEKFGDDISKASVGVSIYTSLSELIHPSLKKLVSCAPSDIAALIKIIDGLIEENENLENSCNVIKEKIKFAGSSQCGFCKHFFQKRYDEPCKSCQKGQINLKNWIFDEERFKMHE